MLVLTRSVSLLGGTLGSSLRNCVCGAVLAPDAQSLFSTQAISDDSHSSSPAAEARSIDAEASTSGQGATRRLRRRTLTVSDRLKKRVYTEEEDTKTIIGAAIIERYPIVFPPLPEWELDFLEWQQQWNSWKYKSLPSGWLNTDKDVDAASETAQFQPEPIVTEADQKNDIRSLRRNTPGYLYLMLRSGESKRWQFPHAVNDVEESLKETVQRSLAESVGDSIETEILGNVPCAHVQTDAGEVFYMSGLVLDGNVKMDPLARSRQIRDYAWLTKDEIISEYAEDPAMLKMLETVLMT